MLSGDIYNFFFGKAEIYDKEMADRSASGASPSDKRRASYGIYKPRKIFVKHTNLNVFKRRLLYSLAGLDYESGIGGILRKLGKPKDMILKCAKGDENYVEIASIGQIERYRVKLKTGGYLLKCELYRGTTPATEFDITSGESSDLKDKDKAIGYNIRYGKEYRVLPPYVPPPNKFLRWSILSPTGRRGEKGEDLICKMIKKAYEEQRGDNNNETYTKNIAAIESIMNTNRFFTLRVNGKQKRLERVFNTHVVEIAGVFSGEDEAESFKGKIIKLIDEYCDKRGAEGEGEASPPVVAQVRAVPAVDTPAPAPASPPLPTSEGEREAPSQPQPALADPDTASPPPPTSAVGGGGGYRENPKRKSRKNTKRKNIRRKSNKRKNTKRKITKRKITKRKITKRKITKRKITKRKKKKNTKKR